MRESWSHLEDGGADGVPEFDPVPLRARHDGWTRERQIEFLRALADCGCVEEACQRVGKSATSAYALRNRPLAGSFRCAWNAALDVGTRRLADAAFSRALHGVETPIFFQGQQVGTRRRYDERLTQFLLRYRDPIGYGRQNDREDFVQPEEGPALKFNILLHRLSMELRRNDLDAIDKGAGRGRGEEAVLHGDCDYEWGEDEGDVASTSSTFDGISPDL